MQNGGDLTMLLRRMFLAESDLMKTITDPGMVVSL